MKERNQGHGSAYGSFILDRRGTILGFDEEIEGLTGWPAAEVVGRNKNLSSPLDGEDQGAVTLPLYEGDIEMLTGSRNLRLTINCRDGRQIEAEATVSRLAGPGEQVLVTLLRVVALYAGARERSAVGITDSLTGLPNQEAFAKELAHDVKAAGHSARPLALILADIDHLREINDRCGREAGNEVLQKLAGILRVSVAEPGRIFRLADDDFAILLPGVGRGDARQLAASLRSTTERHTFLVDDENRITLSLGAASFPTDAETESDLVERAQEALAEARSMGRNRVWCYLRKPRVPLEVPVFFDGDDALLVGYTRDMSPSGLFVQTSEPMGIGMRCALAFPLPGHDGRVHVIGRVVRTVPTEITQPSESLRVPGMGVEFERFGGSTDRRAIDTYLHDREATTLRPEKGPLSL